MSTEDTTDHTFLERYPFLHHLPLEEQQAVFKRAQKSPVGILIPGLVFVLFILALWLGGHIFTRMGGLLLVWIVLLFTATATAALMLKWVYPALMKKDLKQRGLFLKN